MAVKIREFKQNPGNSAIAYYRYSSEAQKESSIDQQKEAARDFAERNGLTIIKEYEEPAMSGTRDDRPMFNLMLYEIQKLRPANLILWKTDRLSRDKIDLVLAKKKLRENGVKIQLIAEAIPEGDEATELLLESLYEGMAASFIVSHRRNVMRGLNYNAERGIYNGNLIFGYKGEVDKPYEINETQAEIVKKIFTDYANGKPKQQICNELNEKGIKTVRNKPFKVSSISHILSNDTYLGIYKWDTIRIEGGVPQIIDEELFRKVQKKIASNCRGGKGAARKLNPDSDIADYWLTGKLFCKECGGAMTGASGTGKKGDLFFYYSCFNHRKHKCNMKSKSKELIEKIVRHVLQDILRDGACRFEMAERIYGYYQSMNVNTLYLESLKSQLDDVEKKLANVIKAIEKGIFNHTTANRMHELEEQKEKLQTEIAVEENKQQYALTADMILKYFDSFIGDVNDPEVLKRVLEIFVNRIYVTEDKLIFTFHYSDDEREIDIDEMKEYLDNLENIYELLNIPTGNEKIPRKKKRKKDSDGTEVIPYFFP